LRVSITGGSGFIGKSLVQFHLQRGDRIRVLSRVPSSDHDEIEFIQGDLLDPSFNPDKFVDQSEVLYHCAAELVDESKMYQLHVEGTKRLFDSAKHNVSKWVQLSSVGAYGPMSSGTVTEANFDKPLGVYEKTKSEADSFLMNSDSNNMDVSIVRPSIVFGETMTNQSLIQMTNMIKKGMFFYIGRKDSIVNYVHVLDVVRALYACATNKNAAGNIYIVSQSIALEDMVEALSNGAGANTPWVRIPESLVRLLVKLLPRNLPLTEARVNALTNQCCYDSSAINADLGYSFQDDLMPAFEHYASSI
jgi:nucleoside-diphosphate-sugar epimerase